jgi:hypothetical protein
MLKQVMMYGWETWPMIKNSKIMLHKRRRTILQVYGTVTEQGLWRIKINQELRELYNTSDLVADSKRRRLEWLGHVIGMYQGWQATNKLEEKQVGPD